MVDYALPDFDKCREWIKNARTMGNSWDDIRFAMKGDDTQLQKFLDAQKEINWWNVSIEDWKKLVALQKEAEEQTKIISIKSEQALIMDEGEDSDVSVPTSPQSSWQLYKKKLLEQKGFKKEIVDQIEGTTIRLLRRLRRGTENNKPVKGLVIGNVQSGKTANMAALMAMSADWGWNVFIILSGTIENLRKQTQTRLFNDLSDVGNLRWMSLEHLSRQSPQGSRAQDLHFESNFNERYFTVCLKNSGRLKKMIQWIQADANKKRQMRILVIDDEADQAGINTADISTSERKKVNQCICDIVNNNTEKHKPSDTPYLAMNYIGYTATPYANILNEAGEESLYPRSFIATLGVSKEYFGPQQIFGVTGGDYGGLDIVRVISDDNLDEIKEIHEGTGIEGLIPDSLKDALCWFIDGVACMRYWGYRKPVSMLIHTSQRTPHHKNIAEAIMGWYATDSKTEIRNHCEKVWNDETKKFDKAKLREQYQDYDIDDSHIRDYPGFMDICPGIDELIAEKPTHIELGDDGDLHYNNGIHLCIDNCKNNGVNEDGMYMRLAYPDESSMPDKAPAFIVIGGTTLSRGLTLEGLISTYFLRSVCQADTLMQMGRWFGYRKGYELLPRIWITKKTNSQFRFLSDLDQELRDEIYNMDITGKIPANYGPRVKNTPGYSFIRITARNRMQSAQDTDMDYSGSFNQTYLFDRDRDRLHDNLVNTFDFIESLKQPEKHKEINGHADGTFIWRNVDFSRVKEYLEKYHFNENMHFANNIESIIQWVTTITDEGKLNKWNIILPSNGDKDASVWHSPIGDIRKATRTQKIESVGKPYIDIGALRNPKDIVADIDLSDNSLPQEVAQVLNHFTSGQAKSVRNIAGLDTTPQMIIYIVDKDSKKRRDSQTRVDLNAPEDIAGLCLNIPGGQQGADYAATVSIHVNNNIFDDDGDLEATNAD